MNRKHLIATIVLAVAGSSAFAGGEFNPETGYAHDSAAKPLTVAQVRAETQAARQQGPVNVTRDDLMFAGDVSVASRADVKAELAQARAEQPAIGDASLRFATEPVRASTLTRQEVRASVRG